MDRELKNLTLNISQLAALSGVHRQTAAARLQNLPVAGGHESNLKLYRVVDIVGISGITTAGCRRRNGRA